MRDELIKELAEHLGHVAEEEVAFWIMASQQVDSPVVEYNAVAAKVMDLMNFIEFMAKYKMVCQEDPINKDLYPEAARYAYEHGHPYYGHAVEVRPDGQRVVVFYIANPIPEMIEVGEYHRICNASIKKDINAFDIEYNSEGQIVRFKAVLE